MFLEAIIFGAYNSSTMCTFFFPTWSEQLGLVKPKIPESYKCAVLPYQRDSSQSSQYYEETADQEPSIDMLGQVFSHESAVKHATGEAIFVDDMPEFKGNHFLFTTIYIAIYSYCPILQL